MPVAMGKWPTGVNDLIELLGKSYRVEFSVSALGVTIMLPSWLIQCAWGWALSFGSSCIGMSRRKPLPCARESSSRTLLSPFCDTCTWSLFVLVMTCAGAAPTSIFLTKFPLVLLNTASFVSNHWV